MGARKRTSSAWALWNRNRGLCLESIRQTKREVIFDHCYDSDLTREEWRELVRDGWFKAVRVTVAKLEAAESALSASNAEAEALRTALEEACDQILDSYRTWVADDIEGHPRPGQIPRYDRGRALLRALTAAREEQ